MSQWRAHQRAEHWVVLWRCRYTAGRKVRLGWGWPASPTRRARARAGAPPGRSGAAPARRAARRPPAAASRAARPRRRPRRTPPTRPTRPAPSAAGGTRTCSEHTTLTAHLPTSTHIKGPFSVSSPLIWLARCIRCRRNTVRMNSLQTCEYKVIYICNKKCKNTWSLVYICHVTKNYSNEDQFSWYSTFPVPLR